MDEQFLRTFCGAAVTAQVNAKSMKQIGAICLVGLLQDLQLRSGKLSRVILEQTLIQKIFECVVLKIVIPEIRICFLPDLKRIIGLGQVQPEVLSAEKCIADSCPCHMFPKEDGQFFAKVVFCILGQFQIPDADQVLAFFYDAAFRKEKMQLAVQILFALGDRKIGKKLKYDDLVLVGRVPVIGSKDRVVLEQLSFQKKIDHFVKFLIPGGLVSQDLLIGENLFQAGGQPGEKSFLNPFVGRVFNAGQKSGVKAAAQDNVEAQKIFLFILQIKMKNAFTEGAFMEFSGPDHGIHFRVLQARLLHDGAVPGILGDGFEIIIDDGHGHMQDFCGDLKQIVQADISGILQGKEPSVVISENLLDQMKNPGERVRAGQVNTVCKSKIAVFGTVENAPEILPFGERCVLEGPVIRKIQRVRRKLRRFFVKLPEGELVAAVLLYVKIFDSVIIKLIR